MSWVADSCKVWKTKPGSSDKYQQTGSFNAVLLDGEFIGDEPYLSAIQNIFDGDEIFIQYPYDSTDTDIHRTHINGDESVKICIF